MNATYVSTAWCGACCLTTDQSSCPTCGGPVRTWAPPLNQPVSPTPPPPGTPGAGDGSGSGAGWTPIAPPEPRAPLDPSRIITWVGAALLVAGALALAAVIWQYAGGHGQMGILAAVTLAAAAGADRLRRRTPVTAEALTAVFAAMIVVDTIAVVVAGYVDVDQVPAWTTVTSGVSALLFLGLARHWRSTAARMAAIGLSTVAGAAAAAWLFGLSTSMTDARAWQILLAAGLLTAAGYASRALPSGAERSALLAATWSAWTVVTLAAVIDVSLGLVSFGTTRPSTPSGFVTAVSVLALVAPPLVVRSRITLTSLLTGAAAGATLVVATMLSAAYVGDAFSDTTMQAAIVGLLAALPVVVALALVLLMPRRVVSPDGRASWPDPVRAARAAALATFAALAVVLTTMAQALALFGVAGASTAAIVVVIPAIALGASALALSERVIGELESTVAVSALAFGLVALCLGTADTVAISTGSVLGIAAGVLAAGTLVVRRPERWWSLQIAATGALVVALILGVDQVEMWSIPAGLVALTVGLAVRRTDDDLSSWITLAPACVLVLVPSLVIGLSGNHQGLRLSLVSALASAVLVEGARRRLKAPTAVAVATLATVLVWMLAPHVHQAPSWAVLVTCGSLLLWVGFTWEARRDGARNSWERWTQWR